MNAIRINPNNSTETQVNSSHLGEKRLLTAAELAKLIGKHPKWLERKRWAGGGPPFRYIGKSPIYEEQDVIAWLESIPKIKHTSQIN